jgi:hypothetical protein
VLRLAAAALALLLALPAAATPGFVQVDGKALLPLGEWSDNFSFPDQSQFSAAPAGRVTLGWAPRDSRYFTVGFEAAYSQLGTSEWEAFTARRTSRVDADARMWSLMAGGTVTLPGRGRSTFAAELHGALGVLLPSGEERFAGSTYSYDFLKPTIAGRLGARGVWRFDPSWDFWAGADLLVAPGAVQHTEALASAGAPLRRSLERRTLTTLEPGLGLRYWFAL